MNIIRKVLFPFSVLYGFITGVRNMLYNKGIFKQEVFDIPVIAVGNLSMGGTGKTPQIEYLINLLLPQYSVATLSRGYKRKSKGFVLASNLDTAQTLGDEPFQFYKKFPNITVAVDAQRANGIKQLLTTTPKPNVILLDDAFQHRKVKAGLYILLTTYNDLYCNDYVLPTGNLRESKNGAKRAQIIVVTKCPKHLLANEQLALKAKLKINNNQQLFFSFIAYDNTVYGSNNSLPLKLIMDSEKLFIAGIANPKSFFDYLNAKKEDCLVYPDHHDFTDKDIADIVEKSKNKIIITTEKDYVRLYPKLLLNNLYYLPIKSSFINNGNQFDASVMQYVKSKIKE